MKETICVKGNTLFSQLRGMMWSRKNTVKHYGAYPSKTNKFRLRLPL